MIGSPSITDTCWSGRVELAGMLRGTGTIHFDSDFIRSTACILLCVNVRFVASAACFSLTGFSTHALILISSLLACSNNWGCLYALSVFYYFYYFTVFIIKQPF